MALWRKASGHKDQSGSLGSQFNGGCTLLMYTKPHMWNTYHNVLQSFTSPNDQTTNVNQYGELDRRWKSIHNRAKNRVWTIRPPQDNVKI